MLRAVLIAAAVLILSSLGTDRAPALCVGDCDGDGAVAVAEIVSGVAIALSRTALGACAAMDADTDGGVTVAELTLAVGFALGGCPPATSCGDPLVAARFGPCVRSENEADCVSAGGEWGRYPFSGMEGCFCPTGQGGCPCRTADDCLSFCNAPLAGGSDWCAGVETGTCDGVSPVAGCFCTAWEHGFTGFCIDP